MQHGIYYAYWEKEWSGDYKYYIEKVSKLGFDILEIAATPIAYYSEKDIKELRTCAEHHNIRLTVGHGPTAEQNIASSDPDIRKNGLAFFTNIFKMMEKLNSTLIGGALYSYWPVDYSKPIDKSGDWQRGVEGVREMGRIAKECGITLGLESLNRFENHVLNTAAETVEFVEETEADNVKVMLDTFHMNIEEQSIGDAIRTAGKYLGHFHTGECNRMVPGKGRIPWREIGDALREIEYDGTVVMEPFVRMGGQVGQDIRVWRDISNGADEEKLDKDACDALVFQRYMLDWK
ncbi:sugar phosphate isomerase/epimerase [Petroclostridium sp. X23]|uniref:D-psicose 3-epimerase n=1 Tax=Petroclostridium sp. X23 TaxID=3045146 RepID=UPI0024AD2B8D|nr:sugar phosphate isomerase/epimerase [Petroclostridium sp. X23]WHH60340.1 sugar phosphate isomerase/epimerase [Petroclostridium sp. X23]